MRRLLLVLTAAMASSPVAASAQDVGVLGQKIVRTHVERLEAVSYQRGREEQSERFTKTVRVGESGEIDVANIAGDIVITRGRGGDAVIEVIKTARAATTDEAREMMQLVDVAISERPGRAEIRTRYPRGDDGRHGHRNMNVAVAFNITAPAGARITARSISGTVKVTGIKGDLAIDSVSGNVVVAEAGRIAHAKSVSGDVQINDTSLEGALDAGSVSGNVVLRRVKARRLDLGSVSGNVAVEEVDCERVTVQSVSGNVQFEGSLARTGRYALKSHSGDVRVAVSGGAGFELEANSFSGHIRSDFPVTIQGGRERGRRQRSLHGVYGDGSAILDLTTFSGSIVIMKR